MVGSGVSRENIHGAERNISVPVRAITAMPSAVERQAKWTHKSLRSAPRLWPTSVVAAEPMP